MTSRWSIIATILFWLTSMAWLVQQKVLPSLLVGEPPNYRKILDAHPEQVTLVRWRLSVNDKPVGTSESSTHKRPDGITEIVSSTRIDRAPLQELTPAGFGNLVRLMGESDLLERGFAFAAETTIEVDALGRPSSLRAKATIGPPRKPGPVAETRTEFLTIDLSGIVQGNTLKLRVKSGEAAYSTSIGLPDDSLFGDMLSPQGMLPDLRVGQRWTFPTYNPIRPPDRAVEILEAAVVSKGSIAWQGERRPVLIVEIRNVAGVGLTSGETTRGRMWVDKNGLVLKQEMTLANARIGFVRIPPEGEPSLPAGAEAAAAQAP